MNNQKNIPGRDYPAARPMKYEIEIVLALLDSSERKQHVSLTALNEAQAREGLASMLPRIAMSGILTWYEDRKEFELDLAPSQIKSVRAKLPEVVTPALVLARAQ